MQALKNQAVPADVILPHVTYQNLPEAIAWLSQHARNVNPADWGATVVNPIALSRSNLLACPIFSKYHPASMARSSFSLAEILDKLEAFYGRQEPTWPTEPYEFLVWWQCGYPASDKACTKGWDQLVNTVGIESEALLRARPQMLTLALKAGGMVPEIRAERLKEIARTVQDELAGDLRAALAGPLPRARKILKGFPGIADPGADRILLFGHIAPIAAVPSNCPHVLARIFSGKESESYATDYREAQIAISRSVAESFEALSRAYLLVKQHGQEICKRTNPKCEKCVVSSSCAYFANSRSAPLR